MLQLKPTKGVMLYILLLAVPALGLLLAKININSAAEQRALTLPPLPVLTPQERISAKLAALPWQPPLPNASNNNQAETGSEGQVKDQFLYQGKQYQLYGIFNTANAFAVLRVSDSNTPGQSLPAAPYRLNEAIADVTLTEITKNRVCLANTDTQFCLYMFKADAHLVKAEQ